MILAERDDMIKGMFRTLIFIIVCLAIPFAYQRISPFRSNMCLTSLPYKTEVFQDIPEVLFRPFSYLAEGTQSYVFLSEDGKTVLKLFKRGGELPLAACELAYENRDLTQVTFLHFHPQRLFPVVKVFDQWGRIHRVEGPFLLQRKAGGFFASLKKAEDKRVLIDSFFSLLEELNRRGIANLDTSLGRNFGFIDGQAIPIDFGKFVYDPNVDNIPHFTKRFKKWAERRIPDQVAYIQGKAEESDFIGGKVM